MFDRFVEGQIGIGIEIVTTEIVYGNITGFDEAGSPVWIFPLGRADFKGYISNSNQNF